MSHIRVLICPVDDPASDQMTELAASELPALDVTALQSTTVPSDLQPPSALAAVRGHLVAASPGWNAPAAATTEVHAIVPV